MEFGLELRGRQIRKTLPYDGGDVVFQSKPSRRNGVFVRKIDLEPSQFAVAIQNRRPLDFFVIVIFGSSPENGHGVDAGVVESSSELDDRDRLQDGVKRTGEQTGLLPRDNGNGAAREFFNGVVTTTARPLLFAQD